MSKFYTLFAFIVILIIPVFSIRTKRWVFDDTGCRTPDNGVGDCRPLSQCPTLNNLSSTREGRIRVAEYICSYKSGIISVCCPSKPLEANGVGNTKKNIDLLPNDCGASYAGHKITNGEQTDLFEFPWQVALHYNDKKYPFSCAGTLINNRYVLTAAHCVVGTAIIGVRLGEYNFKTNPDCVLDRNQTICAPKHIDIPITSKDIITHKGYKPINLKNDIALIRLPNPVEFSQSISPICLPIKESLLKDLGNLTVIGWGRTEIAKPSPILLKVTVPLMHIDQCRKALGPRIAISDNHFCAGGRNGQDSCRGDSGSPIMYTTVDDAEIKWVQAGIVSFGTEYCGSDNIPAMYTKVTQYVNWILENIKP